MDFFSFQSNLNTINAKMVLH